MIVRVGPGNEAGAVTLLQPDDFSRFSVQLAGVDVAEAGRALAATGAGSLVSETEALVSVAAVRRLSDRDGDPAWADGFAAMLSFAASRGWLTEDGSQIRAHLETGDPRPA